MATDPRFTNDLLQALLRQDFQVQGNENESWLESNGVSFRPDEVTGIYLPNQFGGSRSFEQLQWRGDPEGGAGGQFVDTADPQSRADFAAKYPNHVQLRPDQLQSQNVVNPGAVTFDPEWGYVTSKANMTYPDPGGSFLDSLINPLTVFSLMMGVPTLPGGGSGFSSLGNLFTGAPTTAADAAGMIDAAGGVSPVSTGFPESTALQSASGIENPALFPGADAGTGAFDQFGALNSPTGTGMPGTIQQVAGAGGGSGTIANAINKLLGTSLTDTDVSTGVKVGTTAAGLLAGSGAAGGASPLPGSDTSNLDAAKARTRASIAGMFEGQDPRYQGIRDSVLGFQKSNLDRDREEAARKLKFSLLRTGNAGGSLQVDEGSKLNRTYDRGLLDATNLADQAAQSARSSDASTKLDLLGRVDSGLDQDAATASAAEQMRLAGDRATSQGLGTTLGNVFADAGLMFQTDAARRGMTDARKAFQNMFSTVPGSSGGSYTGITGRA